MPQRLLVYYEYAKMAISPIMGFGSFIAFLQTIDSSNKPAVAIIGSIVIAFFTYLGVRATTRSRVEVRQIEVTKSADVDKTSLLLQIFDKAILDIDKARTHFTEELKEQRVDFFEKERESRDHYEEKENTIRQAYHDKQADFQTIIARCSNRLTKIETQLKTMGISITEDCEIIFPEGFERRNK